MATPVLASGTELGFDKSSYLVAPDTSQQIYVEIQDGSGGLAKTDATTYVWVSPSSSTAQISTKISNPYFAPTSSAKLTIARGDSRKSFLYKDSVLGDSIITATSSGLLTAAVKITIGYPPPPPPPPPALPTPTTLPVNTPSVNTTPITPPEPQTNLVPEVVTTLADQTSPVEQVAASPEPPLNVPTVLSDQIINPIVNPIHETSMWEDLIAWFRELFFATISP